MNNSWFILLLHFVLADDIFNGIPNAFDYDTKPTESPDESQGLLDEFDQDLSGQFATVRTIMIVVLVSAVIIAIAKCYFLFRKHNKPNSFDSLPEVHVSTTAPPTTAQRILRQRSRTTSNFNSTAGAGADLPPSYEEVIAQDYGRAHM